MKTMNVILLLVVAVMASNAQAVLPDPLVHYTFDVDATDSGLVGYHGVLMNGAAIQSTEVRIGSGAIEFDGFDDWMDMPGGFGDATTNPELWEMPEVTVTAWLRLESPWSGAGFVADQILATRWAGSSTALHMAHVESAGKIQAWWVTGQIDAFDGVPATPSGWYHMAFVRDAAGAKMYIDGVLSSSLAVAGLTTTFTGFGTTVGAGSSGGGQFWDGQMDDLRIYDVALDIGQIGEVIPEPATIMLLGLGFGFAARRRRRS